MKLLKRIFAIIAVIINVLLLGNVVNAANIGDTKSLERGPLGYYCVQKWDGSKWIYLTYNTTYYTDTNGKRYVAYCLSPGAPGVGYVSGESEGYNVKVKEVINDDRIWRIIKNGYPYKSVQDLNVETVDDAYFATMQAINCVLRGYTLEQAKGLYSAGQFAINGENYSDIQRRGTKTLNAMFSLINIGLNGTETRNSLLNLSVKNVTEFIKENDNYYSQTFKLDSSSSISNYSVEKIENVPTGSYIADVNGNKKTNFNGGDYFKVFVPKNAITQNINGEITVKAIQKNYPIFYGTSQLAGHQDYALCSEEYSEKTVLCNFSVVANKSKLTIIKVDTETNKPLKGVKFQVTNSSGVTNTYTTNDSGKIELNNLYAGKFKIKEIETLQNYNIKSDVIEVDLAFNETKEIKIDNEMKKGSITITKCDKDNENLKLQNVKFKLFNSNGKEVAEGTTNQDGIVKFTNLPIGKYTLKEIDTLKEYVLMEKEVEIEVQASKNIELKLTNERKKGNLKVIKIDYDNNEIRLKGVKFQLKNEEGKVVAEDVTDDNGEILYTGILEGKYVLKEVETNEEYMLQDIDTNVEIVFEKTAEAIVKNKKIQIKEVPIEIEKIIEKPIEVERIVEIDKPVEIEVEKTVEIEKIIEKPVEKIVYKQAKELPKTGENNFYIYTFITLATFELHIIAILLRYINKKEKNN